MNNTKLEWHETNQQTLVIHLSGEWRLSCTPNNQHELFSHIEKNTSLKTIAFDCSNINRWDTALVLFVNQCIKSSKSAHVDLSKLPIGVQTLIELTQKTNPVETAPAATKCTTKRLIARLIKITNRYTDAIEFIGEFVHNLLLTLVKKAKFRRIDFIQTLHHCGPKALVIISITSFLVGVILAFVGAVQLEQFGAQIYVANLVGLAMSREMGAVMTAILMAGRTGAAFAAELGSMKVNEEIDALQTFGFSTNQFLVVPRVIALTLIMPLLCLYADLMGILGGGLIASTMLDLSVLEFYLQTKQAVDLSDFSIGLVKSVFFGLIVGLTGCYKGMTCGRSSLDVGQSTTSAVVTAIVLIIIVDAAFTYVLNILEI